MADRDRGGRGGWEGGQRSQGQGRGGGYSGGRGRQDSRGGRDTGRDFQQMNTRGRGGRGGSRSGGPGRARTVVNYAQRNPKCLLGPKDQDQVLSGWKSSFITIEANPEGVNKLPPRILRKDPKNFIGELQILLNHFPVNIKFPKVIYHYDIKIERIRADAKSKPEDVAPVPGPSGGGRKTNVNRKRGKPGGGGGGGGRGPSGGGGGAAQQRMLPTELRKRILMHEIPKMQLEYGKPFGIITDFSAALYSVKRLEEKGHRLDREFDGKNLGPEEEGSRFVIRISATTEIVDTSNLKADVNNMKGIEIPKDFVSLERIYSALMRCVRINKYTPMRRSDLIDFTDIPHPLGGGVVSYSGFNALLPITNGWKKFINIEISNLAAYMGGKVFDVLKDLFSDGKYPVDEVTLGHISRWGKDYLEKATDFLKTCKITYSPQAGKTFTKVVVKVHPQSVSQTTFECDGREISVYDYFKRYNGITLKYPDGPLLECKGNQSPKIPAELCTLKAGQSYNRKLNDNQTKKIADVAVKKPEPLQDSINKAIGELNLKNNGLFGAYGMNLENQGRMHSVTAKVLTPPELCYGKQKNTQDSSKRAVIVPEGGEWEIWGHDFEFFQWADITSWGILNLAISRRITVEDAKRFAKALSEKAATKGIKIPPPCLYREADCQDFPQARDANVRILKKELEQFREALQNQKMSFVLVVLPEKGGQVYNHVKQVAELEVGILTQCILSKSFPSTGKNFDSILGNILLKINSKLNKVNHIVLAPPNFPDCFKLFNYPVMIMGADVTHPPPGSTKYVKDQDGNQVEIGPPSFAAVTASIDRTGMPYMMHIQAQKKAGKGAAEVIAGFDQIVVKFLEKYKERTGGAMPVKIIYFRDGVGEGQFQEVLRTEMSAIRRACTNFGKAVNRENYEPRITFVTVQKRHKTRFFIPNSDYNAPPGTVVDTDIIHPIENDFYLLSHKGLMGTSRPTRYHVLWDDSDFSSSEIQTIAYFLCYMFVRCNRSVKIPAPTYYAHWAAKRAEVLSKGWGEELFDNINELNDRLGNRNTVRVFRDHYPMHFV